MTGASTHPRRTWVRWGIAMGVTAILAALVWWAVNHDTEAMPSASPSVAADDDCGGVAHQRIELDAQTVDPAALLCFDVVENSDVTVGVAALEAANEVSFQLRDEAGDTIAQAQSAPDIDPQVATFLATGTYVVEVFGERDSAPPPFLIYTASFPSVAPDDSSASQAIPDHTECGVSVPFVTDGATVDRGDDEPFVCVRVAQAGLLKVGAIAGAEDTDLRMSLYGVDGAGTVEIAANDDTFGLDPEISVDVDPGTYVIAVEAWFGAPTGEFSVYADTDGDFWRRGTASDAGARLDRQVCEASSTSTLAPGDVASFDATAPWCLSLDGSQRVLVEAASLEDTLLVIEILGFDSDGTAQRLAWSTTNATTPDGDTANPSVDITLPDEDLVVVVYPLVDQQTGPYDVRVVAGGDSGATP
ncbi:MAG: hypothetical protein WDZ57_02995 [Demequina sp.]